MCGLLDDMKLDPSLSDEQEWVISRKGWFTPKFLYMELVNYRSLLFPYKGVWISGIPSKSRSSFGTRIWIKFSAWIIYRVEAETWLTDVSCLKEELVNRLFVHCNMTIMVWGFFFSHLKISWSFSCHFCELISS